MGAPVQTHRTKKSNFNFIQLRILQDIDEQLIDRESHFCPCIYDTYLSMSYFRLGEVDYSQVKNLTAEVKLYYTTLMDMRDMASVVSYGRHS